MELRVHAQESVGSAVRLWAWRPWPWAWVFSFKAALRRSARLCFCCLAFLGYPKSKTVAAEISAVGRELLFVAGVLIATRHRAEMHDFTPDAQGNRSIFGDMHPADRVAHEPPRTPYSSLVIS